MRFDNSLASTGGGDPTGEASTVPYGALDQLEGQAVVFTRHDGPGHRRPGFHDGKRCRRVCSVGGAFRLDRECGGLSEATAGGKTKGSRRLATGRVGARSPETRAPMQADSTRG